MTPLWWSILLAVGGIAGIILAGRKNKLGWMLGFLMQVLWIAFALITAQYGFILSAAAYGWVYLANWLKWRKEEGKTQDESTG